MDKTTDNTKCSNDECSMCGDRMDWDQELNNAIHSLVTLSYKNFETPADVVVTGLTYFMDMAKECAPSPEVGRELCEELLQIHFSEEEDNDFTDNEEIKE